MGHEIADMTSEELRHISRKLTTYADIYIGDKEARQMARRCWDVAALLDAAHEWRDKLYEHGIVSKPDKHKMIKAQSKGGAVVSLPTPLDPNAGCNETQAALFLGVSVRTLQAWRVRGGGPPYVKISRVVRYQRGALAAFQEQHTVSSTSEARGGREPPDHE